jgi:hypothetical protein
MRITEKVKIINGYYKDKEGILTGINNNAASVVIRYEVDDVLYGYIRVVVDVFDLEMVL